MRKSLRPKKDFNQTENKDLEPFPEDHMEGPRNNSLMENLHNVILILKTYFIKIH